MGRETFLAGDITVTEGAVNTSAVITTLPLALLPVFAQRQILRGRSAGSLEG